MNEIRKGKGKILLTPGPVHVSKDNFLLLEQLHHRTEDFEELVKESCFMLKELFGTREKVAIVTSSGTGVMEMAVVNFTLPSEKVLVLSAGKFGDRWADILRLHGRNVVYMYLPYEERVNIDKLVSLIDREKPDALALTHVESSTGMLFPLEQFMERVRSSGVRVMVDTIASLVVENLKMDEWGIDVVVGASQKALAVPPGLGFVAVNDRVFEIYSAKDPESYYFDFSGYEREEQDGHVPFTPSTICFQILHHSLKSSRSRGWDDIREKHIQYAEIFYRVFSLMGFEPLSKNPSSAVQVLKVPEGVAGGVNLSEIIRTKTDFIVADGQGNLQGKVIRTGFLGIHRGEILRSFILDVSGLIEEMGQIFDKKMVEEISGELS